MYTYHDDNDVLKKKKFLFLSFKNIKAQVIV